MSEPQSGAPRPAPEQTFIERLRTLDRADLARLKRNAGYTLAESRGVLGLFYRLLPWGVREDDHKHYFLVATLYPLASEGGARNFGATLRRVREATRSPSIDRRFTALLDANAEQLPFRLRQLVRLAKAHDVGINWLQLLRDLHWWSDPARRVQQRWAMAYFAPPDRAPGDAAQAEGTAAPDAGA